MLWLGFATASLLVSRAPARAGSPTCAEAAMAPIQLADDKFTGDVAQYLVDLHDSKAAFDFCGGMLFQLKLSDMLRAHLSEVAKPGDGQPEVFDASKGRMSQIKDYAKNGDADNARLFQGRVWRKADVYESEGWADFKKSFGDKAYGLNHRCYWHLDRQNKLWLSAEDGCEGVYPPSPKRKVLGLF